MSNVISASENLEGWALIAWNGNFVELYQHSDDTHLFIGVVEMRGVDKAPVNHPSQAATVSCRGSIENEEYWITFHAWGPPATIH